MTVSEFYKKEAEYFLNDLFEYLKIQSISTDRKYKPEIKEAVSWLKTKFELLGVDEIKELNNGDGNPVVYGEKIFDPTLPTLLIYGHYDVQPPGDSSEWQTPPFEPSIRKDAVYARGATDNKGQFLTNLYALKYYLEHVEEKKWNIKLVVEGEEEVGGPTINALMDDPNYARYFASDYAYISDGPWAKVDVPSFRFALRGIAYFDLELRASSSDMHSGHYGNTALNVANLAGFIINKMKNILTNNIRIPNIYKTVRKINDSEKSMIDKGSPTWEEVMAQSETFVTTPIRKKKREYSPAVWSGMKPSFDVHGIKTGFTEEDQMKTSIPSTALIKFSIRLVPNMNLENTKLLVQKYLEKIIPKGVAWNLKFLDGNNAYITDPNDEMVKRLIEAYKDGFGQEPALVPGGGSIGLVTALYEKLGVKSLLASIGLPDDHLHGPNEKYNLSQVEGGIKTFISFIEK